MRFNVDVMRSSPGLEAGRTMYENPITECNFRGKVTLEKSLISGWEARYLSDGEHRGLFIRLLSDIWSISIENESATVTNENSEKCKK